MQRAAFAVAGTDYRWADVIAAARHRRVWAGLEAEIREGIACQRGTSETGMQLSAGDIWTAATAFRYERRLTAAEEMEAWLAGWHVTKDEWLDYIRRSLLRQRQAADLATVMASFPVTDTDVAGAAWATAVCSGKLEAFARDLAARLVAFDLSDEPALPGDVLQRFDELESAFGVWCGRVASSSAVRKAIALHHLDWIRVATQWVSFPTVEAAREALMCVRLDGMDLSAVTAMAGTGAVERRFFLEDSEPAMRDELVAATDGELLGPLLSNDGFTVVEVISKTLPSVDDADVVARAEATVVSDAVRREIANRVSWYDPL